MTDPATSTPEAQSGLFAKFLGLVTNQKLSFLAPAVAAVLGVFGYWLFPLKQWVYDKLYPANILFECEVVSLHNPVMQGDTILVFVHLIPQRGTLAAGEIKAVVPVELELEDGKLLTDLDGSEKTKVVPYKFDAVKIGNPLLKCVYMIASGRNIEKNVELQIVRRVDGIPTFTNLSGRWPLSWDKGLGELNIIQTATELKGQFSLQEADSKRSIEGEIVGFANGGNVRLILTPDQTRSSDKTAKETMFANLLEVSGAHDLTICGHMASGKDEPFEGQITEAHAARQDVCKGGNLVAIAPSASQ